MGEKVVHAKTDSLDIRLDIYYYLYDSSMQKPPCDEEVDILHMCVLITFLNKIHTDIDVDID